jgi:hypothetical protein
MGVARSTTPMPVAPKRAPSISALFHNVLLPQLVLIVSHCPLPEPLFQVSTWARALLKPRKIAEQRARTAIIDGKGECAPSGRPEGRLSGLIHKYAHVRCVAFGLGLGARRAHPPEWGCNRRATTPQAKSNATLRAAVLFAAGFVARSSQTHCGFARRSRLACVKNALPRT